MKIAIVSCWFINNYGSLLQSYATSRYFEGKVETCHTVSVANLKPFLNSKKKEYYLKNVYNIPLLFSKVSQGKLALLRKFFPNLKRSFIKRVDRMNDFREKFDFIGENAKDLSEMSEVLKGYDLAILGGDQLWRPDNILPGFYTLEWVDDNIKKVSLSTSFGVSKLDEYSSKKAKDFLSRFSALSVREDSGINIIKDVAGKEAVKVCDPVFLLTKDEWSDLSDDSLCPEKKYIFSYLLGNKKWHREYIKNLSEKTGLPVVSIPDLDTHMVMDSKFDFAYPNASPEQFLGLIKNAEYVCSDSFHVTAFSTIFQRKFNVFKRHSGIKYGTNSRLESFLCSLELSNRCIDSPEYDTGRVLEDINYFDVEEKLQNLISKTKEFINEKILDN